MVIFTILFLIHISESIFSKEIFHCWNAMINFSSKYQLMFNKKIFLKTKTKTKSSNFLLHFKNLSVNWASNFGPTCSTMTLCPNWFGLLQQDIKKPPQPPSTTPPDNQQNRKNSQEPVVHWLGSPTKNFSLGLEGRPLFCWGRVKKKRSLLLQVLGLRPCRKSSSLTTEKFINIDAQ